MDRSDIVLASGGVVSALKSYDRGLRVRWSWEKRKWAVESKVERSDLMIPPIRYVPIVGFKGLFREELLPSKSDRRICYRDRRNVILWSSSIGWDVFEAVVTSDTQRYKSREDFVRRASGNLDEIEAKKQRARDSEHDSFVRAAYDRYRWETNREPMS